MKKNEAHIRPGAQEVSVWPNDFLAGAALGGGDCFFDTLSQGMNRLNLGKPFDVKLLRQACFDYAKDNIDFIYDARTGETWRQAIAKDALAGGYAANSVDETACFESYLIRIRLTAEEGSYSSLGPAIWGRPEIEGRLLCQKYGIKLHLIEKHTINGQEVIVHQLIDSSGARSISANGQINLYNDSKVIHILNQGYAHFVPILHKSSVSNIPKVKTKSPDTLKKPVMSTKNNEYNLLPLAASFGDLEAVKILIAQEVNIEATDENNWTPLHWAASKGDLEVVKFLMAQGANVEATDNDNWTPLYWAACKGHIEVVKFLIAKGANTEATDKNNRTPLHWAALKGDLEVVKVLIAQGANIKTTDKDNWTPLYLATSKGHLGVVNFLIENKANIEVTDNDPKVSHISNKGQAHLVPILHKSSVPNISKIESKSLGTLKKPLVSSKNKVVKFLIDHGENIEATYNDSKVVHISNKRQAHLVPILHKSSASNIPKVKTKSPDTLKGPLVSTKDGEYTLFHLAADFGELEAVKFLTDHGENIEATDNNNWTPLHWAASKGHLEVVRFLIENRANIKATDKDNRTPLYLAALEGHLEVVKFLIDHGENIEATYNDSKVVHISNKGQAHLVTIPHKSSFLNIRKIDGYTPLHLAADFGDLEAVKILINQEVNIEATDKDNWTPLYWAAYNGHLEIVKLLIDHGANIEAIDKNHWTPLYWAVSKSHLEVVKLLIDQGANIEATDKNHWTPLSITVLNGELEVVKFLIAQGANIEATDKDNWTPLHWATLKGSLEAVKFLIAQGANIEATDKDNWTPLHWAALKGDLEVVKVLIAQEANVKATDKDDRTPLYLAAFKGHFEVSKILIDQEVNIKATNNDPKVVYILNKGRDYFVPIHHKSSVPNIPKIDPKSTDTIKELVMSTKGDKYTPLHLAADFGDLKAVKFLIAQGANVKASNKDQSVATTDPLVEAEVRLQASMQQWAGFSSGDNLAANPYRGHRVDTLLTPQWTSTSINRD